MVCKKIRNVESRLDSVRELRFGPVGTETESEVEDDTSWVSRWSPRLDTRRVQKRFVHRQDPYLKSGIEGVAYVKNKGDL